MSYTIDLTLSDDGTCTWRLYTRGGTVHVDDGTANNLEQASAEARTRMLVEHRSTGTSQ